MSSSKLRVVLMTLLCPTAVDCLALHLRFHAVIDILWLSEDSLLMSLHPVAWWTRFGTSLVNKLCPVSLTPSAGSQAWSANS